MEKIWQNLKEKLCNYCDRNGFKEVILGLSGGLDSAIVSVLAADALGAENVHAVMMKTNYTSEQSLRIAREIAGLNGLTYLEIDIQPVIDEQKRFLTEAMGEDPQKVTLENLQARERGKTLMAFSNQFGYLVLACGNKSEIAMGYCTLYGDTCGGIAPIGNLYKSELFELARWRNNHGLVLPEEVITRAPSAELSSGQKDEDSLPPYKILDAVLCQYCDEGKKEAEIVEKGYDADTVKGIIRQFQKMEFKRKQLPELL